MTSQQLDIFLNCIALRSFRKVAQVMYLSPSTVARQIEALEEELGITIFQRDTHNMLLTPEGLHLIRFANRFSESYASLLADISSDSHPRMHQRNFTIGCYLCDGTYDTISSVVSSPPPDSFSRPVRFFFPREGQIQQNVLDGSIQVGVDTSAMLRANREVFDMVPLSRCHYKLMVSMNHPLAQAESITLAQLVQYYPTWGDYLPDGDYRDNVASRKISSAVDFLALAEFTVEKFDSIMPWASECICGQHQEPFMLIIPEVLRFLDDMSIHYVSIKARGLVCEYMAFWRKDCYNEDIRTLVEMLRTLP